MIITLTDRERIFLGWDDPHTEHPRELRRTRRGVVYELTPDDVLELYTVAETSAHGGGCDPSASRTASGLLRKVERHRERAQ